jgi:hypothetical protein
MGSRHVQQPVCCLCNRCRPGGVSSFIWGPPVFCSFTVFNFPNYNAAPFRTLLLFQVAPPGFNYTLPEAEETVCYYFFYRRIL